MAEDPSFGKQHKELKSLSETGTEAKKLAKQREKRRQKKRAQKAKHKATKAQQVKLLTDGDSFYLSDDDDDDEDDMENELLGIALFTPCAFKLVIQAALATQNKSLVLSRLFSALKPVSSVSKPKVHVTTNLLRTLLALEKIEIRNVHSKDTNNTNNSFNIVVQSTKYIPSQHGYVLIPVQVILDLRLGNHPDPLLVDVFGLPLAIEIQQRDSIQAADKLVQAQTAEEIKLTNEKEELYVTLSYVNAPCWLLKTCARSIPDFENAAVISKLWWDGKLNNRFSSFGEVFFYDCDETPPATCTVADYVNLDLTLAELWGNKIQYTRLLLHLAGNDVPQLVTIIESLSLVSTTQVEESKALDEPLPALVPTITIQEKKYVITPCALATVCAEEFNMMNAKPSIVVFYQRLLSVLCVSAPVEISHELISILFKRGALTIIRNANYAILSCHEQFSCKKEHARLDADMHCIKVNLKSKSELGICGFGLHKSKVRVDKEFQNLTLDQLRRRWYFHVHGTTLCNISEKTLESVYGHDTENQVLWAQSLLPYLDSGKVVLHPGNKILFLSQIESMILAEIHTDQSLDVALASWTFPLYRLLGFEFHHVVFLRDGSALKNTMIGSSAQRQQQPPTAVIENKKEEEANISKQQPKMEQASCPGGWPNESNLLSVRHLYNHPAETEKEKEIIIRRVPDGSQLTYIGRLLDHPAYAGAESIGLDELMAQDFSVWSISQQLTSETKEEHLQPLRKRWWPITDLLDELHHLHGQLKATEIEATLARKSYTLIEKNQVAAVAQLAHKLIAKQEECDKVHKQVQETREQIANLKAQHQKETEQHAKQIQDLETKVDGITSKYHIEIQQHISDATVKIKKEMDTAKERARVAEQNLQLSKKETNKAKEQAKNYKASCESLQACLKAAEQDVVLVKQHSQKKIVELQKEAQKSKSAFNIISAEVVQHRQNSESHTKALKELQAKTADLIPMLQATREDRDQIAKLLHNAQYHQAQQLKQQLPLSSASVIASIGEIRETVTKMSLSELEAFESHLSTLSKTVVQTIVLKKQEEEMKESNLCIVCLELPKDHVLIPCGHQIVCITCAKLPACPLCRAKVTGSVRVFKS